MSNSKISKLMCMTTCGLTFIVNQSPRGRYLILYGSICSVLVGSCRKRYKRCKLNKLHHPAYERTCIWSCISQVVIRHFADAFRLSTHLLFSRISSSNIRYSRSSHSSEFPYGQETSHQTIIIKFTSQLRLSFFIYVYFVQCIIWSRRRNFNTTPSLSKFFVYSFISSWS